MVRRGIEDSYYDNHRRCAWFDKGGGGGFSEEFEDKMLVPSYAELLQQGTRGDLAGRKGGGYGLFLLRPSERTWMPY